MKTTNLLILNRSGSMPDDGWYHVVPTGEFSVQADGRRILQVIDDRAIKAMADRFIADGQKLLVDFDHFSYDPDHASEAAGWISEVEARKDGLWARIQWTDAGEPAIVNKRYRFVSPVWLPTECEQLKNNSIRPLRLDSVGLTNQPNMKNMQPLSNRGGEDQLLNSHRSKETKMEKVLEIMGLSADAAESQVVDAVKVLKNRADQADALKNRAETAEGKIQALETAALEAEADAFCAANAAVISNREVVRTQYIANREGTIALIAGLKPKAEEEKTAPISNRQRQPDQEQRAQDESKASAIRNRAHKISKEEGLSFAAAFARAESELK